MNERLWGLTRQRVTTHEAGEADPIVRLFMQHTGLPVERIELVRVEGPDGTVTTYPRERTADEPADELPLTA